MSKTVIALRHLAFEDLGLLDPLLRERGFDRIEYREAGVDDLAHIDPDEPDLLVVLGGPIGAEDEALYPWLRDEQRLVRRRLDSGRPLLGICLGAQLMARVMGARVKPMRHGLKEIGFGPITLTDAGRRSPLAAIPAGQPVLHWHGDQFDLPPGCESLAGTDLCPHQAFLAGPNALALQFHLEADPARLEQWLIGHAGELAQAGIDLGRLRADARQFGPGLRTALAAVLAAWRSTQ